MVVCGQRAAAVLRRLRRLAKDALAFAQPLHAAFLAIGFSCPVPGFD
jgi:hypothetical protein